VNRKLAVPLVHGGLWGRNTNKMSRSRTLRDADQEDLMMLMKLADNRERLEKLKQDLENDAEFEDYEDMQEELDYVNASIRLGILEITGELEEIRDSDEVVDEVLA